MTTARSISPKRTAWTAGGAAASGAALTAAAVLLSPTGPVTAASAGSPPPAPAASAPVAGSLTYNGLTYASTGLIVRPYPGSQTNSGTYWIVRYSVTDTGSTPVAVPASQALVLFGPGGTQTAADASLSGPAPSVLNPGITFTSYEVFNVPSTASPADYTLGFVPYQVVGSQYYAAKALTMAVPPDGASTDKASVNASYQLESVFGNSRQLPSEQTLTIADTVQTNAVAPDLTAPSFKPDTSFLIVDFTLANTTSGDIAISAGDFTLDFGGEVSIAPYNVSTLPGYVQPTGLQTQGGVTIPTGTTFRGSLLFEIPAGTPTTDPQLQFSANGQTRIVSLSPCRTGACPPVLG